MKTLILKVEVPDDSMEGYLIQKLRIYNLNPEIITPPTEEEIFNEAIGKGIVRGMGIIQGATWTLKRLGL